MVHHQSISRIRVTIKVSLTVVDLERHPQQIIRMYTMTIPATTEPAIIPA